MTYAAGTGASTIVWVATRFREEHRQAIDWLNEKTAEDVNFFGVQVSIVRIGNSAPAPLFDVVCKPNEWQKRVRTVARASGVSPRAEQYRAFWSRYLDRVASDYPGWGRRATPQPANWMGFRSPIAGTQIIPAFAAGGRLRHELYVDTGDADANIELFQRLLRDRTVIESAYGRPLEFDEIAGKRACRIAEYRDGDISNEAAWDEYVTWFIDCGIRLRSAISGIAADAT